MCQRDLKRIPIAYVCFHENPGAVKLHGHKHMSEIYGMCKPIVRRSQNMETGWRAGHSLKEMKIPILYSLLGDMNPVQKGMSSSLTCCLIYYENI
ncbi:hypothetical protein ScPMuIL_013939 [Solemya velum]